MADVATAPRRLARRRPTRQRGGTRLAPKVQRNVAAWGFLIGAVLCFTFFSWYPIVREFIMSFQKPMYGGRLHLGGLGQLRRASTTTRRSGIAWRNTLEFTLLALVIGFAVPFAWRSC